MGLLKRSGWILGIAVCAAGIAAGICVLNLGARVVMSMGGFVAVGGPYEIAHPAPEWVALIPLSILASFGFGGLSIWISSRTGGFSLLPLAWAGLFISLGWQFAYFGWNPPGGGVAWGWLLCAVVFIPMGVAPLPAFFRGRGMFGLGAGWVAPRDDTDGDRGFRVAYAIAVALGAVAGVVGGWMLFVAIAGGARVTGV